MHFKTNWLNWRTVIVGDRNLSSGAKGMALYLNIYMNDSHDMAWPSLSTICGEMNYGSKNTAIKHIRELEEKGYLQIQKRYHNSNVYSATIPPEITRKISQSTETEPPIKVQKLNLKSSETEPGVVQKLTPNKQGNNQKNKQDSSKTPFSDFWNVYPRKQGKAKAIPAWNRLPEAKRKLAVNDCQTRFKDTEKQFTPMPASYLNDKRWEDEKIEKKLTAPKDDEQLVSFAKQHELPSTRAGESFWQYRNRLNAEIEKRND